MIIASPSTIASIARGDLRLRRPTGGRAEELSIVVNGQDTLRSGSADCDAVRQQTARGVGCSPVSEALEFGAHYDRLDFG